MSRSLSTAESVAATLPAAPSADANILDEAIWVKDSLAFQTVPTGASISSGSGIELGHAPTKLLPRISGTTRANGQGELAIRFLF